MAEYAAVNNLLEEPAFNWWARDLLKLRRRIVNKVKSRYWSTTHKFGIRLPKSVEEALEIDKITGTDFWAKAIQKERDKVKIAWQALEGVTPEEIRSGKSGKLVGYQEIDCHMVFDVKMDSPGKQDLLLVGTQLRLQAL